MPINPSIALQVNPVESPIARQTRIVGLQDAMLRRDAGAQDLEQRALELQEFRKKTAATKAIQGVLQQKPDAEDDELYGVAGMYADPFVKARRAARTEAVQGGTAKLAQKKAALDNAEKLHGIVSDAAFDLRNIPDPAERKKKHGDLVGGWLRNGLIEPQDAQQLLNSPIDDIALDAEIGQSPKMKVILDNEKAKLDKEQAELKLAHDKIVAPNPNTGLTPKETNDSAIANERLRIDEEKAKTTTTKDERDDALAYAAYAEKHHKPVSGLSATERLKARNEANAMSQRATDWERDLSLLRSDEAAYYKLHPDRMPADGKNLTTAQRANILNDIRNGVTKNAEIANDEKEGEVQKAIQSFRDAGIELVPGHKPVKPLEAPKPKFEIKPANMFADKATSQPAVKPAASSDTALPKPTPQLSIADDATYDAYRKIYKTHEATLKALRDAGWK